MALGIYGYSVYGGAVYGPMTATWDLPSYVVEIAFNTDPPAGTFKLDTSALDGTDTLSQGWFPADFQVIPNVVGFSIRRGRQQESAQMQAGTCDVTFDNNAGNLSPDNPASSYAPNVLPGRRLRVSAVYGGQTYYLFYGLIESYEPSELTPTEARMKITATDYFSYLTKYTLNTTYPAQTDAARVAAVFADTTTPDMATFVDAASDNLLATTLTDQDALSHHYDITAATRGLLYVRADGTIAWESRHYRQAQARCLTDQLWLKQAPTFTDGSKPFATIRYVLDNRDVYNDVRVHATGTGEAEQDQADSGSQALYGKRTLKVDSALMGAGEATYQAQYLLAAYAQPTPRVEQIDLDPATDGAGGQMWAAVLGREISDRIRITKQGPGSLDLDRSFLIEGVQHEVTFDAQGPDHKVSWQLSDARLAAQTAFLLDTSTLDTNSYTLVY